MEHQQPHHQNHPAGHSADGSAKTIPGPHHAKPEDLEALAHVELALSRKHKGEDPDNALAIVALAFWVILPFPPLIFILAFIAQNHSKKRGYINTLAQVNVTISSIATIAILFVMAVIAFISLQTNQ